MHVQTHDLMIVVALKDTVILGSWAFVKLDMCSYINKKC